MDDDELLTTIDLALAALGHPDTNLPPDRANRTTAIGRLLSVRDSLAPRTPNGIKAKILHEIEHHVRRYNMISDDYWDRAEPITQIYDWCDKRIGHSPATFDEIQEHVQDAVDALELG
jgi:hypothetical protein